MTENILKNEEQARSKKATKDEGFESAGGPITVACPLQDEAEGAAFECRGARSSPTAGTTISIESNRIESKLIQPFRFSEPLAVVISLKRSTI